MTAETVDPIHGAARAAMRAGTIDDALTAMIEALRSSFEVDGGIIAVFTPSDTARIVALQMELPSQFSIGQEISLGLTPAVMAAVSDLIRERALVLPIGDGRYGLMEDMWVRDGLRTLAAVPLRSESGVLGVLVFASTTRGAFDDGDAALFRALGTGIEAHVIDLIDRSGRADHPSDD